MKCRPEISSRFAQREREHFWSHPDNNRPPTHLAAKGHGFKHRRSVFFACGWWKATSGALCCDLFSSEFVLPFTFGFDDFPSAWQQRKKCWSVFHRFSRSLETSACSHISKESTIAVIFSPTCSDLPFAKIKKMQNINHNQLDQNIDFLLYAMYSAVSGDFW